jgi:hypothetical protein
MATARSTALSAKRVRSELMPLACLARGTDTECVWWRALPAWRGRRPRRALAGRCLVVSCANDRVVARFVYTTLRSFVTGSGRQRVERYRLAVFRLADFRRTLLP